MNVKKLFEAHSIDLALLLLLTQVCHVTDQTHTICQSISPLKQCLIRARLPG